MTTTYPMLPFTSLADLLGALDGIAPDDTYLPFEERKSRTRP